MRERSNRAAATDRPSLRSDGVRSSVLPRSRPVQDDLRRGYGDLSDPPGSLRLRADPHHRLRGHPGVRRAVPAQHHDDPVPDPVACGDRAQSPDRLHRPPVARHWRLHGGRRLRLLQARDRFSASEHPRLDRPQRLRFGGGGRGVRPAEPAHQGLLSRGRDAGCAVLSRMVLCPRALAGELQRFRRDRGAERDPVRRVCHRAERNAGDALFRRADHRRRDGLDRLQHRAWADRAHVDGGARHGHRGAADRHPPAQRQASRLRRVVLLCRRRGRA